MEIAIFAGSRKNANFDIFNWSEYEVDHQVCRRSRVFVCNCQWRCIRWWWRVAGAGFAGVGRCRCGCAGGGLTQGQEVIFYPARQAACWAARPASGSESVNADSRRSGLADQVLIRKYLGWPPNILSGQTTQLSLSPNFRFWPGVCCSLGFSSNQTASRRTQIPRSCLPSPAHAIAVWLMLSF